TYTPVDGALTIENRRHNGLNQIAKISVVGETPPTPTIEFYPGRQTGELTQNEFQECSDIAASRRNKGVLWIIVDQAPTSPFAGEAVHLFAIDPQGRLLQTCTLKDAAGSDILAIDLECMEIGPGPDPARQYLYIGDTGTNHTARTPTSNPTKLYRLPEPEVTGTVDAPTTSTVTAEVLVYRYADLDPAPNVETLLVDPTSGMQYLGTKGADEVVLYQIAPSDWGASGLVTATEAVTIITDNMGGHPNLDLATGGSVSPDGTLIAIRNIVRAYAWQRPPGTAFVDAFNDVGNPPIEIPVPGTAGGEPKGEGLAFDERGGYFTSSEYNPSVPETGPIFYYQRRGEALSYDPSGNLLFDGQRAYEWDALNRLINVYRLPASGIDLVPIAAYDYDAFGRRVRKVVSNGGLNNNVPNVELDFVYSGWRCVEERDMTGDANTPYRQYVWGIYLDELLQLKVLASAGINGFPDDEELYPLQDLLYRTTGLATASDGQVREAYDTDAYGNTLIFR
ncbi:MAG: hypothetical protein WD875_19765, partial [Pirellulales bacterium]